jgi:hypothetical protein
MDEFLWKEEPNLQVVRVVCDMDLAAQWWASRSFGQDLLEMGLHGLGPLQTLL